MADRHILVTTTPSLEGWGIESYLGPVSTHVVAGTGFLTDAAGGRSLSYQRQLASINAEALESLRSQAALLGANAIVGVHIDHDEISGKGKQMLMVTAYGTAVRAEAQERQRGVREADRVVSAEALELGLQNEAIKKKFAEDCANIRPADWNLVIEQRIGEVAGKVLEGFQIVQKTLGALDLEQERQVRVKYFLALSREEAIAALYDGLSVYRGVSELIQKIIFAGAFFDYDRIRALLTAGDLFLRKQALVVALANKPAYMRKDVQCLAELIALIGSSFPNRAQYVEEKNVFDGSVERKWICQCGQKNDPKEVWCKGCGADSVRVRVLGNQAPDRRRDAAQKAANPGDAPGVNRFVEADGPPSRKTSHGPPAPPGVQQAFRIGRENCLSVRLPSFALPDQEQPGAVASDRQPIIGQETIVPAFPENRKHFLVRQVTFKGERDGAISDRPCVSSARSRRSPFDRGTLRSRARARSTEADARRQGLLLRQEFQASGP